jgi:arylsulfatase
MLDHTHQSDDGLWHTRSGRDFEHTAMAGEVLRPAGYHTWWPGKHHASFNPYERGFDHFSGFLGSAINFWNPGGKQAREGEPTPGWAADHTWAFDDTSHEGGICTPMVVH